MDDEDRPPRVPAPREGGREDVGHPVVPAPRAVPALECLPRTAGTVATMSARSTPAPGAAVVLAERRSTALAVRDDSLADRWCSWGHGVLRAVVRVVGAAAAGVRAWIDSLAPCPAGR